MKYKKNFLLLLAPLAFIIFFAGVIRHDVNEKKYLKLAQKKQFDCVGQVVKENEMNGSCVLISDRFVLSAAHVFIDYDQKPDTSVVDGQKIISYIAYNHRKTDVDKLYLLFKGQKVKVKSIKLHPNYLDSSTQGTCDFALLELEQPLKNINPAKVNTSFDELNYNVVGVGFGAFGKADRSDSGWEFNIKVAGENVVDSIGGPKYQGLQTLLMCDFDHQTRKDCNKLGSPIPRPLEYISTGGDSGGALFRKKEKKWELIGICSGAGIEIEQYKKSKFYGQIMEWTRVSAFTKWIEEQKN